MNESGSAPPSDAAVISRRMVQILRDVSGRGPTTARTTIGRDHVLVVFGETLSSGERTLVEHGMEAEVAAIRRGYQEVMRPQAVQMIEETINRSVVGFMSSNHFAPDLAAELFILDPNGFSDNRAPSEADVRA
jgi:uncharacterized protein YbcI